MDQQQPQQDKNIHALITQISQILLTDLSNTIQVHVDKEP